MTGFGVEYLLATVSYEHYISLTRGVLKTLKGTFILVTRLLRWCKFVKVSGVICRQLCGLPLSDITV